MTKNKKQYILGIIFVLLAGVLWGHTGFFVRLLEKRNVTSAETSVMRLVFTFVLMFAGLLIFNRKALKIKPRFLWYCLGAGACGMIGSSIFYFHAIQMTSLSVAAVLMYTAPTIVVLLSVFVFREKLTLRRISCCVVAFIGAALVTGVIGGAGNISVVGVIYGCAAGFSYALYSVFCSLAIKDGAEPISMTVYSFGFAMLGILFTADLPTLVGKMCADVSIPLLALCQAVLTCLLPYVFYTIGLKYVDAAKASIMSTVEVVVASLIGLVSFGEAATLAGSIGMVLVILSIVFLNVRFKKAK